MNELLNQILACGAQKAAVIRREDIRYDLVFREICAGNACGGYGACHMCPPDVGPAEALIAQAQAFAGGVLYQNVYPLEDSFDYEGMMDARRAHRACSARIQQLLPKGTLHLSVGGCGVCERCAKKDGEPCRFPDKALASLEAYCINVHDTAENVGLKYINGQDTVTYFGLVLMGEDAHA